MDNTRGSIFMILAMAAFAVEDMFIKAAAGFAPLGVVLTLFGLGGMLIFIGLTWRRGEKVFNRAALSRPILIRAACEVVGRLCFALAIILTPLSSASAILQATPLVVVIGAALLFGEHVGFKRWLAILIGLVGVLMIVRPGLDGFNPASIFAVISTLGFAGRDLATRAAPPVLSNMQLGVYGFFVLIPTGIVLQLFGGLFGFEAVNLQTLITDPNAVWLILGSVVFGVVAYYALTIAMRTGDVSVVTPFRYTRLLFALILGMLIFNEEPDAMTLLGGLLVVVSGAYTLLQSRRSKVVIDGPRLILR